MYLQDLTEEGALRQTSPLTSTRLVIGEDAAVRQTVDVTLDLPLEVGHAPQPVDQKERDGEDNLQAA